MRDAFAWKQKGNTALGIKVLKNRLSQVYG